MDRDDAPVEVVLSEERARVATRKVPVERVRVRKRVVTHTRTLTVEERREELTIERIPVAAGADVPDGGDGDDEVVLVLHEEVAEVVTRVVPVERVRVAREAVADTTVVETEMRREQVTLESDRPRS